MEGEGEFHPLLFFANISLYLYRVLEVLWWPAGFYASYLRKTRDRYDPARRPTSTRVKSPGRGVPYNGFITNALKALWIEVAFCLPTVHRCENKSASTWWRHYLLARWRWAQRLPIATTGGLGLRIPPTPWLMELHILLGQSQVSGKYFVATIAT